MKTNTEQNILKEKNLEEIYNNWLNRKYSEDVSTGIKIAISKGYQLAQKENQQARQDGLNQGADICKVQMENLKKEIAEKVEKLKERIEYFENNSDWNMPLRLKEEIDKIFKETK